MKKNRVFIFLGLTVLLVSIAIFSYFILFVQSNLSVDEENTVCVVREETEAQLVFSKSGLQLRNMSSWQFAARLKKLTLV